MIACRCALILQGKAFVSTSAAYRNGMPGFAQFNLLIALEREVDCSWDQQLHTMLGSHYPTKLLLIVDGPDVPQFLRIIEGSSDLACTATADTVQASKLALRDQPHIILMDTALPTGDGLPLLA